MSKISEHTLPQKSPPDFVYNPPDVPLDVVFCDDHFLVLSKPHGLLSVPGRLPEHQDSLEIRAQAEYPDARIVHRLDMCTSGLIIMARTASTHRNLGLQFERRKTKKVYIARVWGHVERDSGKVDLPLRCDWPNRPMQMVDHDLGKSSQTEWKVLDREGAGHSRVALYPITGRTHQLRVHMAMLGHPILGDEFYAHDDALNEEDRLHLHAYKLMVHHPDDGREMWFESECPF